MESSKRKGKIDTENLMSHNLFIISWLRPWSYEKVMIADVLVPVMRYNAMLNNMASHSFFIMSMHSQRNYEQIMTHNVCVHILRWRAANGCETEETRKTS